MDGRAHVDAGRADAGRTAGSRHHGLTDAERLADWELVYAGAVRTPLMAIAQTISSRGREQGVMAEYFATIADAHRVTGRLPEGLDLHDTADRRGKSVEESTARLARMVGCDLADPGFWDAGLAIIEDQLVAAEDAARAAGRI